MNFIRIASLILQSTLLSSCASYGLNQNHAEKKWMRPHEEVNALIESGNYDEARKVAKDKHVIAFEGIDRIDSSEKCIPVMTNCQKHQTTIQEVRSCLYDLENVCDERYLTPNHENTFSKLKNKLIDQKEEFSISSDVKGMCDEGTKWGYFRAGKKESQHILFTDWPDLAKLYGKFEKKDKCEEARLLEEGYNTSKQCFARYLGPKKTREVFKAIAMADNLKKPIYFSDIKKCENAMKSGFRYNDGNENTFHFSPHGSESKDRFIKGCEKEDITVCEPNKAGEVFTLEII